MSKQVNIPVRRSPSKADLAAADRFVSGTKKSAKAEKLVRVTFDLDEELHRRMKTYCSIHGRKMVDEVRELFEKHFPELPTTKKQ
jgi:hypothetical protein